MNMLQEHNRLRRLHGVGDLQFDHDACVKAQQWSQYMANNNYFEHATYEIMGNCGENLIMFPTNFNFNDHINNMG